MAENQQRLQSEASAEKNAKDMQRAHSVVKGTAISSRWTESKKRSTMF